MTDQEIEKLREKLGSDYSVKRQNWAITVELVDIWKGVEFAQNYMSKVIYPIGQIEYFDRNDQKYWRPSTESAYVEQLKAKAHELYGEINHGDRFDCSIFGVWVSDSVIELSANRTWMYSKEHDRLTLDSFCLYMKGKWAKKIDEPIWVEGEWINYNDDYLTVRFGFNYKGNHPNAVQISAHLAQCLEDYLNKSQ